VLLYRKQASKYPPHQIPPEHRLYPSLIGSIGLPIGLFWFGWTARPGVSWASPAAAMIIFAWGNLCVFVSTMQYITDTYHGNVVASAASANSLARYGFAGVFPLFTIQSKFFRSFCTGTQANSRQCTRSWGLTGLVVFLGSLRWRCCRFRGCCSNMVLRLGPRALMRLFSLVEDFVFILRFA
jgi:hypothetical protein